MIIYINYSPTILIFDSPILVLVNQLMILRQVCETNYYKIIIITAADIHSLFCHAYNIYNYTHNNTTDVNTIVVF